MQLGMQRRPPVMRKGDSDVCFCMKTERLKEKSNRKESRNEVECSPWCLFVLVSKAQKMHRAILVLWPIRTRLKMPHFTGPISRTTLKNAVPLFLYGPN